MLLGRAYLARMSSAASRKSVRDRSLPLSHPCLARPSFYWRPCLPSCCLPLRSQHATDQTSWRTRAYRCRLIEQGFRGGTRATVPRFTRSPILCSPCIKAVRLLRTSACSLPARLPGLSSPANSHLRFHLFLLFLSLSLSLSLSLFCSSRSVKISSF